MKHQVTFKIKPISDEREKDYEEMDLKVWRWYEQMIGFNLVGEASEKIVNNYISYCDGDFNFSDNEIEFVFPDSGGRCTVASLISYHWAELLLGYEYDMLDEFLNKHGYAPDEEERDTLETMKNNQNIFVEIEGYYFLVKQDSQSGAIEIISEENKDIIFESLSSARKESIEKQVRENRCDCEFCKILRE